MAGYFMGIHNLLVLGKPVQESLFNLLENDNILDLEEGYKNKVELVMTSRDEPPDLIELADYLTVFVQEKHAYYTGAKTRKVIEY
jgi:cob(I)alamin adenosyltransferase